MEYEPKQKKIKRRGVGRNAINLDTYLNRTRSYSFVDSPLDISSSHESSDAMPYSFTFSELMEGYNSLQEFIENKLFLKFGKVIAVDFGGIGIKIFDDFTPGFLKTSIGVTLTDCRLKDGLVIDKTTNPQPIKMQSSDSHQHYVIFDNILSGTTYGSIKNIIEGEGVDLILERMLLGFNTIFKELNLFMTVFEKWYKILNEDGLMMIQYPSKIGEIELQPLIMKWARRIKKRYNNKLIINVSDDTFSLQKLPGAPKTIKGSFKENKIK